MLSIFSLLGLGWALSAAHIFDQDISDDNVLEDDDKNQELYDSSTEIVPVDHIFEMESEPNEMIHSDEAFVISGNSDDHYELGGNNNLFEGGAGNDLVEAGSGSDEIHGSIGHDTLFGQADNDGLFGGDDADLLDGGLGQDELYGGKGEDILNGRSDNEIDALFGGEGDDVLYAGQSDWVFGGNGSDIFSLGFEDDVRIGDLNVNEDVIEIYYKSPEGPPSLSFRDNSVGVDLIAEGKTIATFDGVSSEDLAGARIVFIMEN